MRVTSNYYQIKKKERNENIHRLRSKIPIASKVCEFSLRHHSDEDLDITLLKTPALRKKKLYWRPYKNQSTQFTYTDF